MANAHRPHRKHARVQTHSWGHLPTDMRGHLFMHLLCKPAVVAGLGEASWGDACTPVPGAGSRRGWRSLHPRPGGCGPCSGPGGRCPGYEGPPRPLDPPGQEPAWGHPRHGAQVGGWRGAVAGAGASECPGPSYPHPSASPPFIQTLTPGPHCPSFEQRQHRPSSPGDLREVALPLRTPLPF